MKIGQGCLLPGEVNLDKFSISIRDPDPRRKKIAQLANNRIAGGWRAGRGTSLENKGAKVSNEFVMGVTGRSVPEHSQKRGLMGALSCKGNPG
jgi:hypothetical protein